MTRKDTDVLIVGAGPYGLATAAHLGETGVPFRIVGRTMESWRRFMPAGMFLKSEGFASSISDPHGRYTLRRFCERFGRPYADLGQPVPLDTFVDYGRWFQRSLVPQVEDAVVQAIDADGDGFHVKLDDGEAFRAARVVVASGHVAFRNVPPQLLRLPAELASHSADHDCLDSFAGREVAVIGAGQSALETAALLLEHGASPQLVVRKPAVAWNDLPEPLPRPMRKRVRAPMAGLGAGWRPWFYSRLPGAFSALPTETRLRIVRETLGPAGAWWLRARVEERIPLRPGRVLVDAAAEEGGVRLRFAGAEGTDDVHADHVVAATGYRVDVTRLCFLGPELRSRLGTVGGAPRLSGSFESSVPGLYFTGLAAAATFGPVLRFVYGTSFAAGRLAHGLVRHRRRSGSAVRRRMLGGERGASPSAVEAQRG